MKRLFHNLDGWRLVLAALILLLLAGAELALWHLLPWQPRAILEEGEFAGFTADGRLRQL